MNLFWRTKSASSPPDPPAGQPRDEEMAPWTLTRTDDQNRPSTHALLIFSAVLVSTAIVPYVLVRSRLDTLHKHVVDLRAANGGLARELRAAMAEVNKGRGEHSHRMLALLKENKDMFEAAAGTLQGHTAALAEYRAALEAHRKACAADMATLKSAEGMLGRVHARLDDVQAALRMRDAELELARVQNRLTQLAMKQKARDMRMKTWQETTARKIAVDVMTEGNRQRGADAEWKKALGQSLADLAAFMQEVEMREGWPPRPVDGRGIERLRSLAKQLEDLALQADDSPKGVFNFDFDNIRSVPQPRTKGLPGGADSATKLQVEEPGERQDSDIRDEDPSCKH